MKSMWRLSKVTIQTHSQPRLGHVGENAGKRDPRSRKSGGSVSRWNHCEGRLERSAARAGWGYVKQLL